VFHEVGDAGPIGRFVTRTSRQPDANGNRPYMRHSLGGKADTVGEDGTANIQIGHWDRAASKCSQRKEAQVYHPSPWRATAGLG
jgi:hypothetical protein